MKWTEDPLVVSATLTQKAAEGDSRSFQQIYDFLASKMYSLCLRYAGNENDANDWYQEGFVKLYKNLHAFRGEGSFEGWARKIFVGICIDCLNKRKLHFLSLDQEAEIASTLHSGYDNLTNADLMKKIQSLPDIYRTIVNLNLIEGYSHKEIAEMLQMTDEGSRSQLFRARTLLQKSLK